MKPNKLYWDSDCFLAWLQAESGKIESCKQVLHLAEAGKVTIVTSTLTLAEVLHLRGSQPIARKDRERVEAFFKRAYIATSPVTRAIAELSRELVWDHGIRPKDAIHVATALDTQVESLHTFDKKLIAKNRRIGEPPLVIERPQRFPASLFKTDQ